MTNHTTLEIQNRALSKKYTELDNSFNEMSARNDQLLTRELNDKKTRDTLQQKYDTMENTYVELFTKYTALETSFNEASANKAKQTALVETL